MPPESYNATLYYDKHGISARMSVTHSQGSQSSGPNSNQSGVIGAELFGDDYTQYDFSSSFDFSEMFGCSDMVPQLTIDVVNINEETRRSYQPVLELGVQLLRFGPYRDGRSARPVLSRRECRRARTSSTRMDAGIITKYADPQTRVCAGAWRGSAGVLFDASSREARFRSMRHGSMPAWMLDVPESLQMKFELQELRIGLCLAQHRHHGVCAGAAAQTA